MAQQGSEQLLSENEQRGIQRLGAMAAELLKSMTANGMEKSEALYVVKEWFVASMTKKPDGKDGADVLVEYMKRLGPKEPKQ